MGGNKPIVTLVSVSQAKIGLTFINRGASQKCKRCEFYKVCVGNLEVNRVYRIVRVRDRSLPCSLYETEMKVVEVVEAEIDTVVPSKVAVEGAIITYKSPECEDQECENRDICFPEGLFDGDRCKILKVIGSLQCRLGLPLRRVLLQRVRAS